MFDTCGVGYFEARKGYVPEAAELNLLLQKNRMKTVTVTSVAEVQLPKTEVVYELAVRGLG